MSTFSSLMQWFAIIYDSFDAVRVNFHQFNSRGQDRYYLGVVQSLFKPGDNLGNRIKSRERILAKFGSLWSDLHKVI